jgi:imidazolonepropionase-like amidohydrolase
VETAAENGTHVAAHAHGTEGIKRAVRAGVRSIEHGSILDAEAIELMAENGTYLVVDLYDSDHIEEVGPGLGYSEEVMRKTAMTAQTQRDGFEAAISKGVKVAFGTDAGVYPHGDNARQLALYTKHGLGTVSAIRSATQWAAELIGRDDLVGSLSPGRYADLVVVDGDPLDDVSILESPAAVMKGGRWVSEPA